MSADATAGRVHHERHDHILKIVIDNPAKKNAFSPEMMEQLSEAFTAARSGRGSLGRRPLCRRRQLHRRARHAEVLRPERGPQAAA